MVIPNKAVVKVAKRLIETYLPDKQVLILRRPFQNGGNLNFR